MAGKCSEIWPSKTPFDVSDTSKPKVACAVCGRSIVGGKANIRAHLATHNLTSFCAKLQEATLSVTCDDCGAEYGSVRLGRSAPPSYALGQLTQHIRRSHFRSPLRCDLCQTPLRHKLQLHDHLIRRHGQGRASGQALVYTAHCDDCAASFTARKDPKRRARIVQVEAAFKVGRHWRRFHSPLQRTVACDVCSAEVFLTSLPAHAARLHRLTVERSGRAPPHTSRCDNCCREFGDTRSDLSRHLASCAYYADKERFAAALEPSKPKPSKRRAVCDLCEVVTLNPRVHWRTQHMGLGCKASRTCDECGWTGAKYETFLSHTRYHRQESGRCDDCHYPVRLPGLARHVAKCKANVGGEGRQTCGHCGWQMPGWVFRHHVPKAGSCPFVGKVNYGLADLL